MSNSVSGINGRRTLPATCISESDGEKITAKKLRQLIDDQDYRCALTGVELEPSTAEVDHIVPRSSGGPNTMCNIQITHTVINRMKGTLSQDEFIEWCRLVTELSQ